MNIIITNKITTITDIEDYILDVLRDRLSFVDKSKQYQLKRLSKTVWGKTSQRAAQLKDEIEQTIVEVAQDGTVSIPTRVLDLVSDVLPLSSAQDLRCDTGIKIPLPWVNKPPVMRDYQQEGHDIIVNHWNGLINLATGLGKTYLAIHAIRSIGRRTLIICPNKSIAIQFHALLTDAFGFSKVGFLGDGKKQIKDITVGIIQSVLNNISTLKKHGIGLIIEDECHHLPCDTFVAIAKELGDVGRIWGLTATDFRNDGKDLLITAGCGPTLIRRDAKWGIENGWLAKPFFIVRKVDTIGKDYPDDKLKNYKTHVLNCDVMKSQIENDARNFLNSGKRVLIVVDEIAHGKELEVKLGIPFATGEDKNSQKYIDDFNANKAQGLIATEGKIGEGVDTRPVEVLIIANFVASKGAVLQIIGRGLRKTPTKDKCLFIDYRPGGSKMLSRHADMRISFYRELTDQVKII